MAQDSYKNHLLNVEKALNKVSPTFCLAKWLNATIYLHRGAGHSCHHPTPHKIPIEGLDQDPTKLHNTQVKIEERTAMLKGLQHPNCNYCWNVENKVDKSGFSDRIVKSSNSWALPYIDEVKLSQEGKNIVPTYLEVSFSKTCQMQCLYCNPVYSSKWASDVVNNGEYAGTMYKKILDEFQEITENQNPYLSAFWQWWPELSKRLKTFRITGGEPLLSKDFWKFTEIAKNGELSHLDVIVNSNLSVSTTDVERLSNWAKLALDNQWVKSFTVVTSLEAVSEKAEFIRYGLNFETILKNILVVRRCHPEINVRITSTLQIFSMFSFAEFLEFIVDFRTQNSLEGLIFDPSYLRNPPFLSLLNAPDKVRKTFVEKTSEVKMKLSRQLTEYENMRLDSILTMLSHENGPADPEYYLAKLYQYMRDFQKRKSVNFLETFPEFFEYWHLCEKVALKNNRDSLI